MCTRTKCGQLIENVDIAESCDAVLSRTVNTAPFASIFKTAVDGTVADVACDFQRLTSSTGASRARAASAPRAVRCKYSVIRDRIASLPRGSTAECRIHCRLNAALHYHQLIPLCYTPSLSLLSTFPYQHHFHWFNSSCRTCRALTAARISLGRGVLPKRSLCCPL